MRWRRSPPTPWRRRISKSSRELDLELTPKKRENPLDRNGCAVRSEIPRRRKSEVKSARNSARAAWTSKDTGRRRKTNGLSKNKAATKLRTIRGRKKKYLMSKEGEITTGRRPLPSEILSVAEGEA